MKQLYATWEFRVAIPDTKGKHVALKIAYASKGDSAVAATVAETAVPEAAGR